MGRNRMRLSNRGAELFSVLFLLVLCALCGTVYFCASLLDMPNEAFAPNVYINDIAVGGRTLSDVRGMFRDKEQFAAGSVVVQIDEDHWNIDLESIDGGYNAVATEDAAFAIGHTGGVLQRLGDVLALRAKPARFYFEIQYNRQKLREQVDQIYARVNVRPQDAKIEFRPDSHELFLITNEIKGKTIDKTALLAQLENNIRTAKLGTVTMHSTPLVAEVTGDALQQATSLAGTYTTALTGDAERNINITLAARSVNGTVLRPGDIFSFNDTTGERSKANGYVDGPTINDSRLVDAPGGGVCQVSTTLYNAALLAGMSVPERHHHSWPVSYAPPGQDATVDFGRKDLRLKNDTDMPIYIIAQVNDLQMTLTVSLYGMPTTELVTVESEQIERLRPDDPVEVTNRRRNIGYRKVLIQERTGVRTKTYRVFEVDGTQVRRELLSEDYYPPVQGKIEVGTRKPESGEGNK